MKKNILTIVAVCGLLVYGCGDHDGHSHEGHSHDGHSHNEQVEHADHDDHDDEAAEEIVLNEGKKWEVNAEMKPFIANAEKLLKQYIDSKGTDYKKLAEQLSAENSSLINSCTMDGKSHDELHKWLHPHLELVDELKNEDNAADAKEVVSELEQSFVTFHTYFQ